ncbi:MAG: hypothetical protein JWN83_2165 [Chitinophagaceae bacterium]|nr:hypothetical protein [Chitinophagaceae bacterium]
MIRTKLPLAFTGLIFFSLLSWHCTKIDTTTLGGGLIPAVDNVNTFDTILNVVANNFDSIPFGKECAVIYATDEHALGYISNDPLFGTTKAVIYTELKPQTIPFAFEAKPADRTLDSIVLVLSYRRVWGDSTIPQRVEVHEITGTFNPDSSSCSTYPYNAAVLGSATYTPARLSDSIKTFRDTTNNQLRIKLSNSFGQSLLARDTMQTDSLFKDFLKGFAIVPDNSGNALTYYGLTDANTKLAIYYTYKRTSLPDTSIVVNFGLYPGDHSANSIIRNRSGAQINNFSNTNSNPAGDNFIYVQTTPGSFAQLKIPGLTGLSNRIIHRAELIMEQVYSTSTVDNYLTPPPFLFIEFKDSANGYYHPVSCDFSTATGQPDILTYGGFKTTVQDASGNSVARYTFNISRYVQKVITKQRAFPTLRLSAPTYVTTPIGYVDECNFPIQPLLFSLNNVAQGRVKLAGGNSSSTAVNRIRLRIIYSKL